MGTTGNSPPHPTFFIAASFQQASWGLKIRTDEKATKTNTKYLRACARLNAQSLRYEAVLEIHPRQYSMVWMAWFIKTSAKLNWKTKTHLYPFKQCSAKWNKNIHLPILVYKKKKSITGSYTDFISRGKKSLCLRFITEKSNNNQSIGPVSFPSYFVDR